MVIYSMPYRTECYSSHSTYLESKSVFPSTILININYTEEEKNISEELYYWSSVISTLHCNCHIIIVLTYDGIKMANDELTEACKRIMNIAKVAIPHHTLLKCLPLNLSNISVNEEVKSLMVLLDETNSKNLIELSPNVSALGQILYAYLMNNFHSDIITLSEFQNHVKVESEKNIVMAAVVSEIRSLLNTLADNGLIICVEHQDTCSIVIRKEHLLQRFSEILIIAQHSSIEHNLGVIDKHNLIDQFDGFEIELVMEILVCFEYCLPIEIDSMKQYYFPDFIGFKGPGHISHNYIILKMEVIRPDQSLSSHYLINLLRELVKIFGSPRLVWNRGIQWNGERGRTIIVKMEKRFKCLTLISDDISFREEIFKNVKETIQKIRQKICPDVEVTSLDTKTDIKKRKDFCAHIINITFHSTCTSKYMLTLHMTRSNHSGFFPLVFIRH